MSCVQSSIRTPRLWQEDASDARGQGELDADSAHPPLVRLGGGVVLPGSRTAGSLPTVASWLPIPPHDLLLVRSYGCGDSLVSWA